MVMRRLPYSLGWFPIEPDPAFDVKGVRPYDSPKRTAAARRTRARILDAAHDVLAEHGYGGTTMRTIADRAGVSVKTIEAAFATKANLLKELIDVRIAGDDEPVPLRDRPAVAEMIAEPDVDRLLELNAAFIADIARRIVVIDRVAREAAPLSESLTALFRTSLDNRRRGAREFVETLATKVALRLDLDLAVDTAWALFDPHLYQLFTEDGGWNHEEFVAWLVDAQRRLLLP
jgi:AcrR family transcriptional regulator